MLILIHFFPPTTGCDKPLGVEDSNIIGDGLITASSYWLEGNSLEYSPDKGRLNAKAVETISAGMWMAGSTVDQWIQVTYIWYNIPFVLLIYLFCFLYSKALVYPSLNDAQETLTYSIFMQGMWDYV